MRLSLVTNMPDRIAQYRDAGPKGSWGVKEQSFSLVSDTPNPFRGALFARASLQGDKSGQFRLDTTHIAICRSRTMRVNDMLVEVCEGWPETTPQSPYGLEDQVAGTYLLKLRVVAFRPMKGRQAYIIIEASEERSGVGLKETW